MTTTLAAPTVPRPTADRTTTGPDPAWARPALLALLAATAVLYLWGLGASGWANSFYSAAAQAGATSWKAFFFGSSDAASSISVDKTPASLWVMALSARLFGVNSWSLLVPQALEGVAAVALLSAAVRRWSGPVAGLVAGAVLALTPVAVLMFRFDNPDALLVLVLVGAAYATVRAVESASTGWLLLAGALVGAGFLTKMLQALLVLPALALVYLVAAPTPLRRRLGQLLGAGTALLVAAGWWVAIVLIVPASARPYIGGSQHNSILELTLGYNGFGRLTGDETGSVGGGRGWGATGWGRLFGAEIGGQVAWLLPASLVLLAAGLWVTRRAPRTDRDRAGLLLWGTWLVVTGLTFSFMQGIFHAYYTVALAPAIGALVASGGALLWRRRDRAGSAAVLALCVAGSALWAHTLLARSAGFLPGLATAVAVVGVALAVLLAGLAWLPWLPGRVASAVAAGAIVVALTGPTAYAVQTAATPHTGAIPTAGPGITGGSGGGFGGGGFGAGRGRAPGLAPPAAGLARGPGGPGGPGGGGGGLLDGSTPGAELVALLRADAASYTWVAAAVGSNNASGYQLATGEPVMAVGGFNGSDPSPTLAQFQRLVAAGAVHYFVGGSGPGQQADGGSSASARIASWVAATYPATTVGGRTVYDLTPGVSGS